MRKTPLMYLLWAIVAIVIVLVALLYLPAYLAR